MSLEADKIGMVAICRARPGMEGELQELVKDAAPWGRGKRGCLEYSVHLDREDPTKFVFYEVWENREALDSHRSDPGFHELIEKMVPLMEGAVEVILLERLA